MTSNKVHHREGSPLRVESWLLQDKEMSDNSRPSSVKRKARKKEDSSVATAASGKPPSQIRPKTASRRKGSYPSNAIIAYEKEESALSEWQREHIVTLVNSSPFPSYTKSIRLSSAPPRAETTPEEKPEKPKLKTKNHAVQATPLSVAKSLQVKLTPHDTNTGNDNNGELHDIHLLAKNLDEKTDTFQEKEDAIFNICEDIAQKVEPCKGPHIDENTIKEIPEQVNAVYAFLKSKLGVESNPDNVIRHLDDRYDKIRELLRQLKENLETYSYPPPSTEGSADINVGQIEHIIRITHRNINNSIQDVLKEIADMKQMRPSQQPIVTQGTDPNSAVILTIVQKVYDLLKPNEDEAPEAIPGPYKGDCRCEQLKNGIPKKDNKSCPSAGFGDMLDMCQKCVNEYKGRVFFGTRDLPQPDDPGLIVVIGQLIQCLEYDNHKELAPLLASLSDRALPLGDDIKTQIYLGLFRMSLCRENTKCPLIISDYMNVNTILEHEFRMHLNKRQSVIDVLGQMLCRFDPIIKDAYIRGSKPCCSLFNAIATRNVMAFKFLVSNKAPLDDVLEGRSVLHELIHQSHKHANEDDEKQWSDALLDMISVFYDHAGSWWKFENREGSDSSDSSSDNESVISGNSADSDDGRFRQGQLNAPHNVGQEFKFNALRYLMGMTDEEGRTPLQYALQYGNPAIVDKILSELPYCFVPDPLEFGYDAPKVGYFVDGIDGSVGNMCTISGLDRIIMRPPREALKLLKLEPFYSMVNDRWRRYYAFGWLWFILYSFYMAVYTACALHRPMDRGSLQELYRSGSDKARLVGEFFVMLGLLCFIYAEIRDFMRLGWVWPWPWTFNGLQRLVNWAFFLLSWCAFGMRFTLHPNEDVVLALALVTGWLNTLYFLVMWREARLIPYILHVIFIRDICCRFFVAFIIAFIASTTATHCVYQGSFLLPGGDVDENNFWLTPLLVYQLYFGLGGNDHVDKARNTGVGYILFIFHLWFFGFMLMNLLVAMVIHTYMLLKRDEEGLCLWLKAWLAQLLDRRLPPWLLISYGSDKTCLANCQSDRMKYRIRNCLRKNIEGKVKVGKEHVVLVSTSP